MDYKKILVACGLLLSAFISGCKKERIYNEPGNLVPKTVDQDATLPSIVVNGTKLHSEAFGHPDSSIVIIIHGGPGSDYRSLLNFKEFAHYGYRVVFYDQGGSGLSQRFPKSHYSDLQLVFDELSGVIAYYKTSAQQRVFLIGHSWGGILATAYINQYPTTISGVIVGEPGGFIWQDILDYVSRSRTVQITTELSNDNTYIDQFLSGKEDEHQILDYKYAIQSAADGNKDNPTGNEGSLLCWRFGSINSVALFELGERIKPNWTTNLNQFNTRVLFIYSQNNKAYGLDWAKHVSSAFLNVELFESVSAGHDMFSFQTGWNNTFPKMLDYLNSY
ncbi:MAG: alpha/beta fold hydrolase [Bacteroidia bacterium]|nr:alpha/beta fold hydrolase [Bacteroidia bacterium]